MTTIISKKKKDGHQQWPDYQYQPIFQDFKRTINPEEEEEQHQHFSTLHPTLKTKKKEVRRTNSTNF